MEKSSTEPGGGPLTPHEGAVGLFAALGGYAAAVIGAALAIALVGAVRGHSLSLHSLAGEASDLVGEWVGFAGAALVAAWAWRRGRDAPRAGAVELLGRELGVRFRLLDLPLGIAAGLASQFLVAPAFEALLLPFVPDLYSRIGGPAHELTAPAHTSLGLALLGVLICVGSPLFEEIYFRGLLLASLAARLAPLGRRSAEVVAVVSSAALFALVHFEALQLLGLFGFGLVLALLQRRSGRLGPGVVAHVTFNAVTVISLALAR